MGGNNLALGVYGTLGVPSVSNIPSGRVFPVSWTDRSGNFWLFGGCGFDSTGTNGALNDLWEFNPATKEWTWVGGSNTVNSGGVSGTPGVPSATNIPGAQSPAASWTDHSGNFWLFEGMSGGPLSDLWEFNPTTKEWTEWTWVIGGSTYTNNQDGVYGTPGIPAPNNVPGMRGGSSSWTDSSDNLWLFGGSSWNGYLNDLWKFNPATKEWTWMSGSNTGTVNSSGQPGVYGTLGVPSASNVPSGRASSVSWTDRSGNFWLFGGYGGENLQDLNDLWEFSPATNEWTWMGGSNSTVFASGVKPSGNDGTVGVASSSNVPSARQWADSWIDTSGNFWLFGGCGDDLSGMPGLLNDLWEFNPSAKTWTLVSGVDPGLFDATTIDASGIYGTQGVASPFNNPGGTSGGASWTDSSGNLWLFAGGLNNLWRYQP